MDIRVGSSHVFTLCDNYITKPKNNSKPLKTCFSNTKMKENVNVMLIDSDVCCTGSSTGKVLLESLTTD